MTIAGVFLLQPIAQSLSFHNFADQRAWLGIPNFGDVVSNLPFLFGGLSGLALLRESSVSRSIRLIYALLFLGVILTGIGSAYYHSNPNNDTLIWDRIPMTIVFMSFLSATVAELIDQRLGTRLLIPLVLVGITSVVWWHYTEGQGRGDLRLYFLVQYYPIVFIPLIIGLYFDRTYKPVLRSLIWVVVWYVIAKLFEQLDRPIYATLGISGHTLKHLAAALSSWYFVVLFKWKYTSSSKAHPISIN
jgi:hypothetical protein